MALWDAWPGGGGSLGVHVNVHHSLQRFGIKVCFFCYGGGLLGSCSTLLAPFSCSTEPHLHSPAPSFREQLCLRFKFENVLNDL